MEIIDISVPVVEGKMPIYPGNPGLSMRFHASFDAGDDVCLTEAVFGVHTGTHLDAPMHYLHDAGGIETLDLKTPDGSRPGDRDRKPRVHHGGRTLDEKSGGRHALSHQDAKFRRGMVGETIPPPITAT